MRIAFALAALALLAGCLPEKITRPPYSVQVKPAARGLTQVASTVVTIRTFEDVGVNRVWIDDRRDVQCTIESPYYSARILTPARVVTPVFGGVSQRFEVTCRYDGMSATRSNDCYYFAGEPGSSSDAAGRCVRDDVSVIFKR